MSTTHELDVKAEVKWARALIGDLAGGRKKDLRMRVPAEPLDDDLRLCALLDKTLELSAEADALRARVASMLRAAWEMGYAQGIETQKPGWRGGIDMGEIRDAYVDNVLRLVPDHPGGANEMVAAPKDAEMPSGWTIHDALDCAAKIPDAVAELSDTKAKERPDGPFRREHVAISLAAREIAAGIRQLKTAKAPEMPSAKWSWKFPVSTMAVLVDSELDGNVLGIAYADGTFIGPNDEEGTAEPRTLTAAKAALLQAAKAAKGAK